MFAITVLLFFTFRDGHEELCTTLLLEMGNLPTPNNASGDGEDDQYPTSPLNLGQPEFAAKARRKMPPSSGIAYCNFSERTDAGGPWSQAIVFGLPSASPGMPVNFGGA